ncbi:hypothetical protein ACF1AE_18645 [Streptomyces sp. NPDC014986]|uniref:hypothetical protein n=1 Tax=Streptomyces sp. NPDC014986 TaxID=3364934 RepID=UPI003702CE85
MRRPTSPVIGTAEHRRAVSRLVAAQRPHRNVPDGYWVAAANPAAAYNAVTGSVPRAEVTRAAVLSDGAPCLAEDYGLTDWAGPPDILEAAGPDELVSRVRQAESTDPDGERRPRYKAGDDSTAVFCRFGRPGPAGRRTVTGRDRCPGGSPGRRGRAKGPARVRVRRGTGHAVPHGPASPASAS